MRTDLEKLVSFATRLGKEMLISGANLERVNVTIEAICKTYGIHDLGLHSLSTMIALSITDDEGEEATKIVKVPRISINMERLRLLTRLVKKIIKEKPPIESLDEMMDEELAKVKTHPDWVVLIGFIIAMATLARLFLGSWQDIIMASVNVCILFGLSKVYEKIHVNRILTNFFSMFLISCLTGLLSMAGFVQNFYIVVITNVFFLLPGIPMVNSVRSLICGNEMNGVIELLKVIIEALTIVAGVCAAYFIFENHIGLALEDAFPPADLTNIVVDLELIFMSFFISFGFGLTMNIPWKEICIAGAGAILVRIVYILCLLGMPTLGFVCVFIPAMSADIFAEVMGQIKKRPATYYLYSYISPLIPGGLIAYSMFGAIWHNGELFVNNIISLLVSLLGISIGFVVASSVMHYIRKIKVNKIMNIVVKKGK